MIADIPAPVLLTYDRQRKFDCDAIRAINEGCW